VLPLQCKLLWYRNPRGQHKPQVYRNKLDSSQINTVHFNIHCVSEKTSQTVWDELDQRIIDKAIKQWRTRLRACVEAKGGHFEHKL